MPAPVVAVCFDAASAAAVVEGGGMVVLCGTDGEALAASAVALRPAGRVSVMIGDPADDAVQAAARAMARELFAQEPFAQEPIVLPPPTDF